MGTAGSGKKINKNTKCVYCESYNVVSSKIISNKIKHDSRQYKCHDCGKYFSVSINKLGDMRVVVISDTHCGHMTGLTPPEYQLMDDSLYAKFQKESWNWYVNMIERLKPIDVLICNGDMIDGRQEKGGGQELLVGDRFKQIQMAQRCINVFDAKKIYLTKGTPYHVGKLEQFEVDLAEKVGGDIKAVQKLNINGCVFDVRHKIGRSAIPHGRFTTMARRGMWNDLMTIGKSEQRANIIIASHVHYFIYLGHSNNRLMITTPALQGYSEYGAMECEGNVDYGMVKFDISENGVVKDWKCYMADFKNNFNDIETVD